MLDLNHFFGSKNFKEGDNYFQITNPVLNVHNTIFKFIHNMLERQKYFRKFRLAYLVIRRSMFKNGDFLQILKFLTKLR